MKKLKDGIPNLPTGGKFDLAAIMSAGVKMPKTMQIEEIPINLIFDHEDNFFAVDDVQDLRWANGLYLNCWASPESSIASAKADHCTMYHHKTCGK